MLSAGSDTMCHTTYSVVPFCTPTFADFFALWKHIILLILLVLSFNVKIRLGWPSAKFIKLSWIAYIGKKEILTKISNVTKSVVCAI